MPSASHCCNGVQHDVLKRITSLAGGTHYAKFRVLRNSSRQIALGIQFEDTGGDGTPPQTADVYSDRKFKIPSDRGDAWLYRVDGGPLATAAKWHAWQGQQPAETGDCIGLAVDFKKGTITDYKNNKRLGVMARPGHPG